MKIPRCLCVILFAALCATIDAQTTPKTLDIYFIDVEGGAATLIVTPRGESLLIDTGFPGDRDAGRIAHVAIELAGLKQIDHCVITHWHRDHEGGVPALAKLIPIANYYDHGLPDKLASDMQAEFIDPYRQTAEGKRSTLKPGDEIRFKHPGMRVRVLTSAGVVLGEKSALPQARPCGENFEAKPDDPTDNYNSISVLLTFGRFKFFNGGDLTWNIEGRLVCPKNLIGAVDVYQVDHHGQENSNNPALIRAIDPRVAIIDNGARKGGEAGTYARLRSVNGVQAIYQLHRNVQTTDRDNTMSGYIANEKETCQGNFIKLAVAPNSQSYTVSIPARNISRSYRTK